MKFFQNSVISDILNKIKYKNLTGITSQIFVLIKLFELQKFSLICSKKTKVF